MNIGAIIGKTLVESEAKPKLDELKKATKNIEAIFIKDLLKQMRKSVGESAFGKGPGAEMYQDMFDQAIADSASNAGSVGFGQLLYKQLAPKIRAEVEARLKLTKAVVSASSPEPETPTKPIAPLNGEQLLLKSARSSPSQNSGPGTQHDSSQGYKASTAGAVEASGGAFRGSIRNRFTGIDIQN